MRRLRGPDLIPGVSTDRDRCHYSLTVKPTAFVNLVPVHVIIHKVFLMPADHTIVQSDWLYPLSYVESGKGATASVELFRRVNRQDFGACECCLPAVGSKICQRAGAGSVRAPRQRFPRLDPGSCKGRRPHSISVRPLPSDKPDLCGRAYRPL